MIKLQTPQHRGGHECFERVACRDSGSDEQRLLRRCVGQERAEEDAGSGAANAEAHHHGDCESGRRPDCGDLMRANGEREAELRTRDIDHGDAEHDRGVG